MRVHSSPRERREGELKRAMEALRGGGAGRSSSFAVIAKKWSPRVSSTDQFSFRRFSLRWFEVFQTNAASLRFV